MPPKSLGLDYAESYEAPQRGLLQRALGFLSPQYKGYQDFKEARDYMSGTHFQGGDIKRQEEENVRSTQIHSALRDEQFANTRIKGGDRDEQWGQQAESRVLGYATENPANYMYMHQGDEERDGQWGNATDYAVAGSQAGTVYDDSMMDNRMRSIDPYNVANVQYGSKKWGIFPSGYSGSVNENPGIPSKVDVAHWRGQVDELANRELDSSMARHKDNTRMGQY